MWVAIGLLFTCFLAHSVESQEEKGNLLVSLVLFREGDRTPLIMHPNDPNNDKWAAEGVGQVTEVGKKKMYEFGRYLRTRYRKKLVKKRVFRKVVRVRSVKYERNIVSARMVLSGFLAGSSNASSSNSEVANIPIHTEEKDKVLMTDDCPAYMKELKNLVRNSSSFSRLDEQERGFYQNIKKNTGCDCKSFTDIGKCMDPLWVEHTEGMKLPNWCDNSCLKQMQDLYDKNLEAEVGNSKLLNLKVQPFVRDILSKLHDYARGRQKEFQLYMYSCKEDTIPILLQGLRVTNMKPHIPEFGSSVIVEMRKFRRKLNVSFYYKTSTSASLKKLSIKGCGSDCDFGKFMSAIPTQLKKKRLPCS